MINRLITSGRSAEVGQAATDSNFRKNSTKNTILSRRTSCNVRKELRAMKGKVLQLESEKNIEKGYKEGFKNGFKFFILTLTGKYKCLK